VSSAKQVLFLCSGNYYRSRYAEILFNWKAKSAGLAWEAFSRGLELDDRNPGPMSRHTQSALERLAIPLGSYLRPPQPVLEEDFRLAHHIVAVKEAEHRALMRRKFPDWLNRVEFWHVHDLDCCGPEEAIPHLQREVSSLIERLTRQGC
jgi:protein-tyrosine phosphatase